MTGGNFPLDGTACQQYEELIGNLTSGSHSEFEMAKLNDFFTDPVAKLVLAGPQNAAHPHTALCRSQ
jgi:hypothetical protein